MLPFLQLQSKERLVCVIRVILGILFLFSGVIKILDFELFVSAVKSFKIIPLQFNYSFSIVIVSLEVTSGIYLIFGIFIECSLTILYSLIFLFSTALLKVLLLKENNFSCNCLGIFSEYMGDISVLNIIFNLILFGSLYLDPLEYVNGF
ncbi:MauE/DoxX family redox-associated membrane protein [candidate division KSB1 bacterium]